MSDPTNMSEEERAREALREQAEEIARLDRALARQFPNEAGSVTKTEETSPATERLFSRRGLVGWAIAALLAVFVVRMVLPIVFTTVKESIVSSVKESAGNTAVTPVVAPTPPTTVIPAPGAPAPAAPSATPETPAKPTSGPAYVHIKKIIR